MAREPVLTKPHMLSVSIEDVDALTECGGDAALLYLYILRQGVMYDAEEAEKSLKLVHSLKETAETLESIGLISLPKPKPKPAPNLIEREDVPPNYSIADIKQQIDSSGRFKELLDEVGRLLGRVLSTSDMTILFGIYDYVGLPLEVILLLTNWCIHDHEQRYGIGSRPTLRQIEKVSYIWARDGILSLELAEDYIQKQTEKHQVSYEIKKCLGIKDRALSPSEEKYIMSWLDMGFGAAIITEAYDRTIMKKRELVWPYMNRILESWKKKGYTSLEDILNGDSRERQQPKQELSVRPTVRPELSEYERMQKYIDKLNGGDGNGT